MMVATSGQRLAFESALNLNQLVTGASIRQPFLTSPVILTNASVSLLVPWNITQQASIGNFQYNDAVGTANKNLGNGLQLNASYTWRSRWIQLPAIPGYTLQDS